MSNEFNSNVKEVVEVSVLTSAVSGFLKALRDVPLKKDLGFFKKLKLIFSKDTMFLKATEYSDLLMNVDKLELELEEVQKVFNSTCESKDETLALEKNNTTLAREEIQTKKSEILDLKVEVNSLLVDIDNKTDSIKKLQVEISNQATLIDVKSESLTEKTIALAAAMTSNNKLTIKLADSRKEVAKLNKEIVELTADFNNKVTREVRKRCGDGADEMLKAYKKAHPKVKHVDENLPGNVGDDVVTHEPVVTPELPTLEDESVVQPVVDDSDRKKSIPVKVVLDIRKAYASGMRKFEIYPLFPNISKSSILRICNNESYLEPKYQYVAPSCEVNVNTVSDVVAPVETKPSFKRKKIKGEKR